MRSLGIVRKVDHLGRIVIPKELRKTLKLDKGAPMEIFVDDDMIITAKICCGCGLHRNRRNHF